MTSDPSTSAATAIQSDTGKLTRQQVRQQVLDIIDRLFGDDIEDLSVNTDFRFDLGLDSIDMIELAIEFEKHFNVIIKDEELKFVNYVYDMISLICKKLNI